KNRRAPERPRVTRKNERGGSGMGEHAHVGSVRGRDGARLLSRHRRGEEEIVTGAQRTIIRWTVKIAVSAGLMAFLLHKIPSQEIVDLARRADRRLLLASTLVFLASNVLGWFQWHVLLRSSGVALPPGQTFRVYFVGLFFN